MSKMSAHYQDIQDKFIYLENLTDSLAHQASELIGSGESLESIQIEYDIAIDELKEHQKKYPNLHRSIVDY